MKYSLYLICIIFLIIQKSAFSEAPPKKIDLTAFPGQIVEKVVVPIPAEVFAVLDKVGEPDWKSGITHIETDFRTQDRGVIAMSFGSLVAEGFIAVQARSPDDIRKIGIRSLSIAEALGLEDAVKAHSATVIESAADGKWDEVRAELDSTQQTVRDTMSSQRDQEMAGLVSLGGWLRGTHILTALIAEDFTTDKAELLNQPDLVRHFREMVAGLKGSTRSTKEMAQIEKGLGRIQALLKDNESFGLEFVTQMNQITKEMLDQFYFEKGKPE